ncbi:MAG: hypothetical protein BWY82_02569 [Verrucomicrobia bacterium ADurb.Bin474]|nr:MAG: hypothetical protein BWY82_02569 [Verrucomicrobia bacterium ADurb.Bin474]
MLLALVRATKVAPLLIRRFIGLIGSSIEPSGSVFDTKPFGDVGEVWFLVIP